MRSDYQQREHYGARNALRICKRSLSIVFLTLLAILTAADDVPAAAQETLPPVDIRASKPRRIISAAPSTPHRAPRAVSRASRIVEPTRDRDVPVAPSSSAEPATEAALRTTPGHQQEQVPASDRPSISSSIPELGDLKKALIERGFNFSVNYTGEVLGNPTGGVRRRTIYEGLLEMVVDGDLDKIAGLTGATFHIDSYQIHGLGLSTCCISNFSTISGIEARATARLFDAWFQQKLFGDMASIRIGQLAADNEFFISDFGALFINGTFSWMNINEANLPSGGPGYPMATPGVRLKVAPNDQVTILAALFNGDPSGAGFTGLQQIKDPAGVNFRLKDPPLVIGEAQFKYNQDKNSIGLPGTIKLAAWRHFGKFADQHFGNDGLSLADPSSSGVPLVHRGDYGVYGIIDQMVWRLPGDDANKGVGVFARLSASPSDRNLMNFYAEGGINFIGLLDERPHDMFGLAAAYSPVSPSARSLDRDQAFFTQTAPPIRDHEIALELTYQAQIIPGWVVQPDFQYIFRPGGGVADPINPERGRIRDAAVFGLRTIVKY